MGIYRLVSVIFHLDFYSIYGGLVAVSCLKKQVGIILALDKQLFKNTFARNLWIVTWLSDY